MDKFTYSAQDLIGQHDIVAFHFMKKIFELNYREMALSDDSWLSDFTGCGLSDRDWNVIADEYDKAEKAKMKHCESQRLYESIKNKYWDKWVTKKIEEQYGFIISKTNYPLYEIFKHIADRFDTKDLEKENSTFQFIDDDISFRQSKPLESHDDVQNILDKTFNPYFYAKHTGVTLKYAKYFMNMRKDERLGLYRAYRP